MEQHDQPMKKRSCAVLLILGVGLIGLVAAVPRVCHCLRNCRSSLNSQLTLLAGEVSGP
ncbi:MAG: hypothetical protein GX621_05400 [Pirellulaceae bacterium]|nr:hypothetical protein [Pirellulaceae bacterium]